MKWLPRALTVGVALLLVTPVVLILAARTWPSWAPQAPLLAAGPGARPTADNEVALVTRGALTRGFTVSGVVAPINQVRLGFEQSGIVKELTVKPGDRVRAGDVLAKLDTARLDLAQQQAEAALAAARQRRDAARAGRRPEDLLVARASVDAAQIRYDALRQSASSEELATARAVAAAQQAIARRARARLEATRGGSYSLTPLMTAIRDLRLKFRSLGAEVTADLVTDAQVLLAQLESATGANQAIGEAEAARALTLAAKTRLDQATAGPTSAEAQIVQADVDAANAAVALARARLDRARQGPTTAELTRAMFDVDTARQAVEKAQDEFNKIGNWRVNAQDLRLAEFALGAAEAQLDDALGEHRAVSDRVGDPAHPEAIAAASRISTTAAIVEVARVKIATLTRAPAASDVQAALTLLQSRQTELNDAQNRLTRLRGGASGAEVAAAQTAFETAVANQRVAQSRLEQLRQGPDPGAVLLAQRTYDAALANQRAVEGRAVRSAAAAQQNEMTGARAALSNAASALQQSVGRPEERNNGLERADRELAAATETLQRVVSAISTAELTAAEADSAAAEAAVALAQAQLERVQAGPTAYEIASAQAAVAVARAHLAQLQTAIDSLDLAAANEEVRQAEVNVDLAQLAVLGTVLVAPFDGVVASLDGTVGGLVNGPFVTVADTRELHVTASAPTQLAGLFQVGQEVNVSLDVLPGSSFAGRVTTLAQVPRDDGTFTVTIAFVNPNESLRPGLQATAQGVITLRDRVLSVPTGAVRGDGATRVVDVWSGGRASPREIRVGLLTSERVEVLAGLDENERVLDYRGRPQ